MSADNTIGILITRRRDGQKGQEYRVAHAQAIENIEYQPDYPSAAHPVLNREYARSLFGSSKMFLNKDDAYREATRLYDAVGDVEYGIRELDYAAVYFPASDRKRKRRQRRYRRPELPA